jgi:hypothetical protein
MLNSNMRTVTVRLNPAEHRLLSDLAAAEGIDLEALVRDALTLAPLDPGGGRAHLQLVQDLARCEPRERPAEPALPAR